MTGGWKAKAAHAPTSTAAFCAAADHHLRQTMQAIVLYASVLEERLSDADALRVLHGMQLSLRILEQDFAILLDLCNLEAGLAEPRIAAFRLMPLLEQTIEAARPLAAHKNLALRAVPTRAAVRGDPALVARMLEHLLTGAIRCAESGRVVIGCRRAGAGRLRLQVAGSALAVPAAPGGPAFELSLVQDLGRLLGHAVAATPAAGRGAVFSIDLERAS